MNKGVLAAGLIVGIVLVALIIRVQFYFNPPVDNFTNRLQQVIDAQSQLPDFLDDTSLKTTTISTTEVTPVLQTTGRYHLETTKSLGDGIAIASATQMDQVMVVVLRGSDLYLQLYDTDWLLLSEHLVIQSVDLVNGEPPLATLVTDGEQEQYYIAYTQYVSDQVTIQLVTLDHAFNVTETTSITATPVVMAASSEYLWLYNTANQLQTYSLAGRNLLAQQSLEVGPCQFIIDQNNAVAVAAQSNTLLLNKFNATATMDTAIAVQLEGMQNCLAAARHDEYMMVLGQENGQNVLHVFNDTITTVDPTIDAPATILYPQLGWQGDAAWLIYSTSEVLGDYQLQVASYFPAVAEPLDAAAEYTN